MDTGLFWFLAAVSKGVGNRVYTWFIVACLGQCVEVAGVPDFPELLVGRNRLGHRELPADIRSPAAFVVAPLAATRACVCRLVLGGSGHAPVGHSLFGEVCSRLRPVLEGMQCGVVQNARVSSTGPLAGAGSNPGDVQLVLVLWLCWSCFWSFLWTDFFSWFCFSHL